MEQKSNSKSSAFSGSFFIYLRIFLICMFLTLGLVVIVTSLIQNDMENDTDRALETNHNIAQIQIATEFNNIVNDAMVVKSITTSTLKYHSSKEQVLNAELNIKNMFQSIINTTGKYAAISYIGIDDDVYFYAGKPKTDEISQYMIDLYQVASSEEIPLRAYISRFTYSGQSKSNTFTVTIPVIDYNKELLGYVMMEPYMNVFIDNIKEAISDTSLAFDLLSVEGNNAYYIYSDLHPERATAYDSLSNYYGKTIDNQVSNLDFGDFRTDEGKSFFNIFAIPISNYTGAKHLYSSPGKYILSITMSNKQYEQAINIDTVIMYILHITMLVIGIILSVFLSISSSRRRRLSAKTTRMAQIDNLTGLLNRAYFTENFERIIEDNTDSKYAILFMDLDGFKRINDEYGHDMGDKVLHIVANRLVMSARRDDLIARFGGDEFAMLIKYNNIDQVKYVSNKVVKAISEVMIIDDAEYQVGVSLGVAIYPDHARTVDELYKISDNAMYKVKYSTKNNYYISQGDDNH